MSESDTAPIVGESEASYTIGIIDPRMPKTLEELKALIRAEVHKALGDVVRTTRMSIGMRLR